ncbi:hypothetical protein [Pendulispora albinea]|uniref:Uncharacterized protein n=1 Tax=Pendulispora albinea TaxID=2741071 RepID=A0ABZ2LRJ9_9BACT
MAAFFALSTGLVAAVGHAQTPPSQATPSPPPPAGVVWSGPAAGPDVVYLKDGQNLRGTLTELRIGQSATMQLPQGQSATIRWDGIARIERNGQEIPLQAPIAQPAPPVPQTGPAPETLAYNSGEPIPAGYHVETKPRLGLLISGSILTGIGALGIVAMEAGGNKREEKTAFDVVWGLLFFGPGLPLLLVGLLSPSRTLRRDASQAFWNPPPSDKSHLFGSFKIGFGPTKHGGGLLTIGRQF